MRVALITAVAVLLTACAIEPPAQELQRPMAVRPNKPARETPVSVPGSSEAKARQADRTTQPEPQPAESAPQIYRVTEDGVVGCADPQAVRILRKLRGTGGASPRLLAQAHRDGRCMTVFRINEWASEGTEAELIKLRLIDRSGRDQPVLLYLPRDEVDLQP